MNKTAYQTLAEECMEKEAFVANIAKLGTKIMSNPTASKIVNSGSRFLKSNTGKAIGRGMREGAIYGGFTAAMTPSRDENGNKQNKIGAIARGAIGGAAFGGGANAIGLGLNKGTQLFKNKFSGTSINTPSTPPVSNGFETTASAALEDIYQEKLAAASIGGIMAGVAAGGKKFSKMRGKGFGYLDAGLKAAGSAGIAYGATMAGEKLLDKMTQRNEENAQMRANGITQNLNG